MTSPDINNDTSRITAIGTSNTTEVEHRTQTSESLALRFPSVRISTFIVRLSLGTEMVAFLVYYLATGLYFLTMPSYLWWTGGFSISFGTLLVVITGYVGYFHAEHRFPVAVTVLFAYLAIAETIWSPFLRLSRIFWEWGDIGILYWIYAAIILFCGLFSIVHLIVVSVARNKQRDKELAESGNLEISSTSGTRSARAARFLSMKVRQAVAINLRVVTKHVQRHRSVHAVCIVAIAVAAFCTLGFDQAWFVPAGTTVTVQGQLDQVEIALFTRLEPAAYTAPQRDALNNHSMLMVTWDTPAFVSMATWNADPFHWMEGIESSAEYLTARAAFVSLCEYWRDNYPAVTIMPAVIGIPCGFPTDISTTNSSNGVGGTIWQAKQYLETAVAYNLTNVAGVHADQEDCSDGWLVPDEWRNATRNHEANENWIAFFEWVNASYADPDWQAYFAMTPGRSRFSFQTTFGSSALEGLDGDDDLDVFNRNNVLRVPCWDDYAPMFYQSVMADPDLAHYRMYQNMQALAGSLARYGLGNRIGAYIGITGEGVFRPGVALQQFNGIGNAVVSGYDVLVRQALIAKSFGSRRVTVFLGTTTESMNGVFDAYGINFLDRFNASVNGPNSSVSFAILYKPLADAYLTDGARDFLLTKGNNLALILDLALGGVVVMGVLSDTAIHEKLRTRFRRG